MYINQILSHRFQYVVVVFFDGKNAFFSQGATEQQRATKDSLPPFDVILWGFCGLDEMIKNRTVEWS